MTTFKKLGLSEDILKALVALGFETPTEIQAKAIPPLLDADRDFIGLAQTGTGKTAAFGLPLLEQIDPTNKETQALVLSPTRELGKQIAEQLKQFSKNLFKLNVLPVYGGENISIQLRALKKPQHIIIATPGRLIDLIKRKAINLEAIRYLVLDEADEMLNMGFKEDIDKILSYTPDDKSTWLFSATMPKEIKKIVNSYMDNPIEVRINSDEKINSKISHKYVLVRRDDKAEALKRFIDMYPKMRSVVFCRTRIDTQSLAENLLKSNYKADAIHGDLSQQQRDRVMGRFKKGQLQLLIATDVAARGIDVNDLTHVFHYTLPDDVSYYTHRSGRTARAGKEGISISFVNSRENYKIKRFEKELDISFGKLQIPTADNILKHLITQWCEDVVDANPKGKNISQESIDEVIEHFKGISKAQLISRLLAMHLEQTELLNSRDLNDGLSMSSSDGRSSRRSDRGRGGRQAKSKNRYGNRSGRARRSGSSDRSSRRRASDSDSSSDSKSSSYGSSSRRSRKKDSDQSSDSKSSFKGKSSGKKFSKSKPSSSAKKKSGKVSKRRTKR